MKRKINLMHGRQDISDEELERFKNFDALLSKHYRILNERKPISSKLIIASVALLIVLTAYWWMNLDAPARNVPPASTDSVSTARPAVPTETTGATPKSKVFNKPAVEHTRKDLASQMPTDSLHREPVKDSVSNPLPNALPETSETVPLVKTEPIYIPAEPIEGYEALYAYFGRELIYPQAAVKDSVEGVLIVKFLINKEGKPEQIQTSGALGALFDQEAVRLISQMPLWRPATVNGKPIASKLSLPLTFRITQRK